MTPLPLPTVTPAGVCPHLGAPVAGGPGRRCARGHGTVRPGRAWRLRQAAGGCVGCPDATANVAGATPNVATKPTPRLNCEHLGKRTEFRPGCGGFRCRHECDHPDADRRAAHPDATPGGNCQTCPDHSAVENRGPAVAFGRRHLAYFVYPVAGNGLWRSNVDRLAARWHLFDGVKAVAVATGPGTDSADAVRAALPPDAEVIELANDPKLREVVGWLPLWSRLAEAAGPADVAFYGHAKGVTRPTNRGVTCHPWAAMAGEICWDYWGLVREQLARFPITGPFKKVGRGFSGSRSAWHYSGAFYWVRTADFLSRDWRNPDRQWWGTESTPGVLYRPDEAGCLFHEGKVPSLNLYSPAYLNGTVRPAFEAWRPTVAHLHTRLTLGADRA